MKKSTQISVIVILSIVVLILFARKAKAMFMEMKNENETGTNGNFSVNPFAGGIPGSKNFKASEFNCKDGTPVPVSMYANLQTLIDQLQILRNETGKPITINSGYRTPTHNAAVGGVANSMHLQAAAADIVVIGMTPAAVREKIEELIAAGKMRAGGIGAYSNFTHYDIGPSRRWSQK